MNCLETVKKIVETVIFLKRTFTQGYKIQRTTAKLSDS